MIRIIGWAWSCRKTGLLLLGLLSLCSHGFRVNRVLHGRTQNPPCNIELRESVADAEVDKLMSGDVSTEVEVAGKPMATAAGGRKHTEESKRKIAIANKGKKPWNIGKKHSPETKARIAERTRMAMAKRKQEKLDALGMTAQEYEEKQAKAVKEKRKAKAKGGLTDEGRKRISDSVKKRWQDPGYRERYALANKGNRNHSAETKAKISAAIKAKWEDVEYRAKVNTSAHRPSQEVRSRISATLKRRWQEPEFRERMLNSTHERSDEWKEKVSGKIKALWNDPEYRKNVENGIMKSSSNRTVRAGGVGARNTRKRTAAAKAAQSKKKQQVQAELKRRIRAYALGSTHLLLVEGSLQPSHSLKHVLGAEIWFEEKMRRKTQIEAPLMPDKELQITLLKELLEADSYLPLLEESGLCTVSKAVKDQMLSAAVKGGATSGVSVDWMRLVKEGDKAMKKRLENSSTMAASSSNKSSSPDGGEVECADSFYSVASAASLAAQDSGVGEVRGEEECLDDEYEEYDEEEEEWEELKEQEDIIEVYDESGNLVGTYTDEEWSRMRKEGN